MHDYNIDVLQMQAKKRETLRLADVFDRLDAVYPQDGYARRAAYCRNCGNYLKYGVLADGGAKLVEANFCRQRLCPACSFRRSYRAYANISSVLDWVSAEKPDLRYKFLTLTVRNVTGDDIGSCLGRMAQGFRRLYNADGKKRRFAGIIRTTEITYNSHTNLYHPHYHCILAVPPEYKRGSDLYWTTEQWSEAWRDCMRLDYNPIVDIRSTFRREGAVKEVAKYAVKPGDLLHGFDVDDRVHMLQRGLYRKRLLSYTGVFGDARRSLQIPDEVEDSLVDTISRDDVFEAFAVYHWGFGVNNYILCKELSGNAGDQEREVAVEVNADN